LFFGTIMSAARSKLMDYSQRVEVSRQSGVKFANEIITPDRRRGRGAASNATGRFEPMKREAFDDGWDADEEAPLFKTEVIHERARTIITRNESPDISFDRSINPYRGCEHGCFYCYARPTHAYLGLSPGLDFESKLFVKDGAAALLARELGARNYRPQTIALGANTDPYQPIERQYRVTRSVLEVLAKANHPVGIVTKSNLVLRDLDILGPMAAKGLAKVYISVTTLDRDLARKMEPRAPTPGRRIDAIEQLAAAGVPVGVMTAPIIPAVNDDEMERILARAHNAGAREAGYVLLRLPLELRDMFREWLQINFPDKLRHALSLLQSTHGGKDYESQWGKRMAGSGPYAWMIGRRFEIAAARLGFNEAPAKLRSDLFLAPEPEAGKEAKQLSLF
jgi:DNA repair photolyase